MIVEVAAKDAGAFWALFGGLPIHELGEVTREPRLQIAGMKGEPLIDQDAHALAKVFREPLYKAFGEELPQSPV